MSDRSVYAIASGKGGVGKTTTAINLGAMLADRGHEVVVVDTDLGMANLADFLDFDIGSPTLQEVLAGDADVDPALHEAPGDIDVLPSAPDIEAFVQSEPANLEGVVADLRERYDYVLLDTGAGVSFDVLVPMALADGVLLVATPDVASVRDTAKTGELAERVETEVVGAVLTQRSSDILTADDVEETLGTDVLAVIPEDEAVPMGIDAGRPLAAFAPNAPAGRAYRDLAAVLTGEADPDPELDLDDGNVDVEFDAEPPGGGDPAGSKESRPTDEQSPPDRPGTEEAAESVRKAIRDDDSGGLLGGELSKAAEEIRAEAGQSTDESVADLRASDPDRDAGGDRDPVEAADAGVESTGGIEDATGKADADTGETGDATEGADDVTGGTDDVTGETDDATEGTDGGDWSNDGEARSVDDLLDEHLGDGRTDDFGDGGNDRGNEVDDFGDGTDDLGDERADDLDDGTGDFGGEADDVGHQTDAFRDADDALADADDVLTDADEGSRGGEGAAKSEESAPGGPDAASQSGDATGASADATTETGVPFGEADRKGRVGQRERDDTGRRERDDTERRERDDASGADGRRDRQSGPGGQASPRGGRDGSDEMPADGNAGTAGHGSDETAGDRQTLDADIPDPDADRSDDDRDDDTVLDRLGSLFR